MILPAFPVPALFALATLLTVEQVYDCISTTLIIHKKRGREANGIVGWWMKQAESLGRWINGRLGLGGDTADFVVSHMWWLIKVPAITGIWFGVITHNPSVFLGYLMVAMALLYAWVLVHNYRIAWRQA